MMCLCQVGAEAMHVRDTAVLKGMLDALVTVIMLVITLWRTLLEDRLLVHRAGENPGGHQGGILIVFAL